MRELHVPCTAAEAEALSDALLSAGALSVSIEDADEGTDHEQPLFGEPGLEPLEAAWARNRLVVLLPDEADADLMITLAAAAAGMAVPENVRMVTVPDADWVRLTQSQFEPIAVDQRIWIVPTWHKVPADAQQPGRVLLRLDPGLAFGTGSHPTTHLCLQWLARHELAGRSVLDYGCGSGILAIAAAMLGASPVRGIDIDPQAIEATRLNALANGVMIQAALPDDSSAGWSAQVVVANILSNPLKALAPLLAASVEAGGWLVLSGVLERQAEEVAAAYAPWIPLTVHDARDGWVCLHGQARS
jgi:ribosomal protein L11 methyltransferase